MCLTIVCRSTVGQGKLWLCVPGNLRGEQSDDLHEEVSVITPHLFVWVWLGQENPE